MGASLIADTRGGGGEPDPVDRRHIGHGRGSEWRDFGGHGVRLRTSSAQHGTAGSLSLWEKERVSASRKSRNYCEAELGLLLRRGRGGSGRSRRQRSWLIEALDLGAFAQLRDEVRLRPTRYVIRDLVLDLLE